MKINKIIFSISYLLVIVLINTNLCFAANKNDITSGPGLVDMQIAGDENTGFPKTVTSNGLTVIPDFKNPMRCSLNVKNHVSTHYNFPKMTFNFDNDPVKSEAVSQHFNIQMLNNLPTIMSNSYNNKSYTNDYFYWGTNSKRRNWTMDKVGLKTFDGNIIELEFSTPDYKNDGMVNIKASYDIANNILTVK